MLNTVITLRQVSHAVCAEHPTPEKRSGRPSLLWPERVQVLIDYICSSRLARQLTYLQLSLHFIAWGVSEYAIRGALRKAGFRRYIARAKPHLSDKNKSDRLRWAQEHVNWSLE